MAMAARWGGGSLRGWCAVTVGLLLGSLIGVGVVPGAAFAGPRDQQWYLDQIGVPKAHELTTGEGVRIGMVHMGVPMGHPDLAGRVLPPVKVGLDEMKRADPSERGTAGATALAGLMVARGGSGLLGVAPDAEILPVSCTMGTDFDRCMRWLTDQGVKVIVFANYPTFVVPSAQADGIRYALSKNVVVVMSRVMFAEIPAVHQTGVVVVSGVGSDGAANPEPEVSVAPTVRAPTAVPGGRSMIGLTKVGDEIGFGELEAALGDELSAAIVGGVVALIRARYPKLDAASVINRLVSTAKDTGPTGKDSEYGYGIVDAAAAVTGEAPEVSGNPLGDPGPPDPTRSPRSRGVATLVGAGVVGLLLIGAVVAGVAVVARRRRPPAPRRA